MPEWMKRMFNLMPCMEEDGAGGGQGEEAQPEDVPTEYMGADLSFIEDSETRKKAIEAIKVKDGKVTGAMQIKAKLENVARATGATPEQVLDSYQQLLQHYQSTSQHKPEEKREESLLKKAFMEDVLLTDAQADKVAKLIEQKIDEMAESKTKSIQEVLQRDKRTSAERKAEEATKELLSDYPAFSKLDESQQRALKDGLVNMSLQSGREPDSLMALSVAVLLHGNPKEFVAELKREAVKEYTTKKKTDSDGVGKGTPKEGVPAKVEVKGKSIRQIARSIAEAAEQGG